MGMIINLTPYAVGGLAGKDADGLPMFVAIVKASYEWQQDGSVRPITPAPIQEADQFADVPATSGLLAASELSPPKPRVDVLLRGTLSFPKPIIEVDVALRVGTRLRKVVRVFGARHWLPGMVHDMVPSKPRPTQALPFAWELSFGGSDAQDTRASEPRNPAGTGVTKRPEHLALLDFGAQEAKLLSTSTGNVVATYPQARLVRFRSERLLQYRTDCQLYEVDVKGSHEARPVGPDLCGEASAAADGRVWIVAQRLSEATRDSANYFSNLTRIDGATGKAVPISTPSQFHTPKLCRRHPAFARAVAAGVRRTQATVGSPMPTSLHHGGSGSRMRKTRDRVHVRAPATIAARLYEQLRVLYPTDREVWEPLLDLLATLGDRPALQALVDDLVEKLMSRSDRGAVRLAWAKFLESTGDTGETTSAALRDVLLEEPGHPQALALLADIYERRGDVGEAVNLLSEALSNGEGAAGSASRATLARRLGDLVKKADPAQAKEVYRSALAASLPDPAVKRSLQASLAELLTGDGEAAERAALPPSAASPKVVGRSMAAPPSILTGHWIAMLGTDRQRPLHAVGHSRSLVQAGLMVSPTRHR